MIGCLNTSQVQKCLSDPRIAHGVLKPVSELAFLHNIVPRLEVSGVFLAV